MLKLAPQKPFYAAAARRQERSGQRRIEPLSLTAEEVPA
jgi:hypothetical protein